MTRIEALRWLSRELERHYDKEEVHTLARQILAHFRAENAITEGQTDYGVILKSKDFSDCLAKFVGGVPLAYIFNKCFFFESEFFVDESVLIPRLDSESMIAAASEVLLGHPQFTRVFDFGCGSGALGLSLLKRHPNLMGTFFDISPAALAVAKKNSVLLGITDRCLFVHRDLCLQHSCDGEADLIVANPPYISRDDSDIDKAVMTYEPSIALFSEDHGLSHLKAWIELASKSLSTKGYLFCEMGWKQRDSVLEFMRASDSWSDISVGQDVAGRDRFVKARRSR